MMANYKEQAKKSYLAYFKKIYVYITIKIHPKSIRIIVVVFKTLIKNVLDNQNYNIKKKKNSQTFMDNLDKLLVKF